MNTVAIIDYGMGNLHSIGKAMEHVGGNARVVISPDPETLLRADRVVFPGVGAIGHCMDELQRLGLVDALAEIARTRPLLGVCLGLQALLDSSEENEGTDCLGIVPGRVQRFPEPLMDGASIRLKVPHMGWNQVRHDRDHPMWREIPQDSRFYFVHSYFALPAQPEHSTGKTTHGIEFTSALAKGNVFAVQFHPEKSQQVGLQLLANFVHWDGNTQ